MRTDRRALIHAGQPDWPTIASQSPDQLTDMLTAWQDWERNHDPSGHRFPRAKRHDDKTLAVIRELQTCPPYALHSSV